jgi:dolichol kinase
LDVDITGSSKPAGAAGTLRAFPRETTPGELGPTTLESRRKLAHALPALIPFAMLAIYHEDPLPPWNLAVVVGAAAALTWLSYRRRKAISRADERWALTCIAYPVAPVLTLCLFPHRAEFAGVVLVVVACGDAAAALGGRLFGKRSLPWNHRKTWIGSICFVAAAAPLAAILYLAEAKPRVELLQAAVCAICAALAGALAESLPLRSADNLRVGFAAAISVVATHALFFSDVSP